MVPKAKGNATTWYTNIMSLFLVTLEEINRMVKAFSKENDEEAKHLSKHLVAEVHLVSRNIAPTIPTIAPADIKATKLGLILNNAGSQM